MHVTKVKKIAWTRPPDQWIKINTYGGKIDNPGNIWAGGIQRDTEGNLILAFT